MEGEELRREVGSRTDLCPQQRSYQARHQNDQTQLVGASELPDSQSNQDLMKNMRQKRQHATSSEQGAGSNSTPLSHSDLSQRTVCVQHCRRQRIELKALGEKLKHARSTRETDAVEHERQMQQKDEELRLCHLEISKLRSSVDSYTRQKLILQPQQDLKDADIVDKYEHLCTAMGDWEEIQFGDLDNPLESLQHVMFTPAGIKLLEAYLSIQGEARIAIKHPTTGNIMLTYLIHSYLHDTILAENMCWPSLQPDFERFVSFIKCGMKTMQPPRGVTTVFLF